MLLANRYRYYDEEEEEEEKGFVTLVCYLVAACILCQSAIVSQELAQTRRVRSPSLSCSSFLHGHMDQLIVYVVCGQTNRQKEESVFMKTKKMEKSLTKRDGRKEGRKYSYISYLPSYIAR